MERKELNALMRAVQKYGSIKDQALITLLLHTGLRVFEACSLLKEDLTLKERSGLVRVREGKGGKYREVPLNVTVRRTIEIYLVDINGLWLFPGRKGHITTRTAFTWKIYGSAFEYKFLSSFIGGIIVGALVFGDY